MKRSSFLAVHGIALILAASPCLRAADFFVATDGDDAAPGTSEQPFATLERARDAVRASREGKPYAEATREARVVLRSGTHRLAKTLVLEPVDSGLIILAAHGERAVLSGGRVVTGWEPVRDGVVKADVSKLGLPDLKFRELYCDGRRQHWARVPNFDRQNPRRGGFLRNAGLVQPNTKTIFRYRAGELDPSRWKQPAGAWVVFHDSLNYRQTWSPLKPETIDPARRTFAVANGDYVLSGQSPYFLCGLLEELDAPGEWCVDQQAKAVHFMPPAGQAEDHEIVVPALDTIISLQGDATTGGTATNVRLVGLTFIECRKEAVLMKGATRCEVTACELRNVGTGVYLADDTHRCRVAGCDITQTLRDGISVKGTSTDHARVSDHTIDNNYIWDFGWGDIHNRCGGVFLWRCSRITVTHNHIHDGPRYAIGTDVGNDFEIAWNRCHHVNLTTSDTSIIEGGTAGDWAMPDDEEHRRNREHNWGNSIHHNLCHDSGGWGPHGRGTWFFPDYSWGIYLDLCNSGWHVHDNIAYDTVLGGFMQNAGLENRVENNIFIGGQRSQVRFNNWPGYLMAGHRCERNIICYQGRSAALYEAENVLPQHCLYARNLIHCQSGRPRVAGVARNGAADSWIAWQALGQDAGSVLGDPLFVDAANHDYRLAPDSPALKLGFRPIDLARAGNYASVERRSWPRPEEPVVRPPADYTEPARATDQPAHRDYEDYEIGEPERLVASGPKDGRGIVEVTDETAASGRHSLRFGQTAVDSAKPAMSPYLSYPCSADTGRVTIGLALRRAPDSGFLFECRDAPQKYRRGPAFAVDGKGQLNVAGKALLTIPADEWVRIETECILGTGNPGTFQLAVTLPNAAPQVFAGLPLDPQFQRQQIFVLQLSGTQPSTCWLDDLRVETDE
jgi:hypothetical protein